MKQYFILIFAFLVLYFFKPFFLNSLLPIPSDTIVGLYHPYRDLYAQTNPNGLPFKNFLITDPVRQQYPWKNLAIQTEKKGEIPLWNPYNFSGTPLLANLQTGAFYPLNVIFFLLPFQYAWSLFILLQPLLAGLFMYLFLRNIKLSQSASVMGALVFCFCGFSIAWLEWGNVLHTALWLPLILYSKDKLLEKLSIPFVVLWVFAECSAFFAGHLQTWFYLAVFASLYLLYRIFEKSREEKKQFVSTFFKKLLPFIFILVVIIVILLIQIIPTFQFIAQSARDVDVIGFTQAGWFIPWQHLVQFVIPDFFGNPTTLNYWGVWNYAEFIGYVGILPFIFAFLALFRRDHKDSYFFITLLVLALLFALPNPIAQIPFELQLPFLSSAQPTRLLFIVDFCLAVLCSFGFNSFMKKQKAAFLSAIPVLLVVLGSWYIVLSKYGSISSQNMVVLKNNLIFPTILVGGSIILLGAYRFVSKFKQSELFALIFILFVSFDLFRFGLKFIPFTGKEFLFPNTQTLSYIKENQGEYRTMTTDSRIFPPNFSIMYGIYSIEGDDPLYLKRYGELMAAQGRNKPDISAPFGFNRIITPHNYYSPIINLLGVKYVLSFDQNLSLKKIAEEGKTVLYENQNAFPRAFFVNFLINSQSKEETIAKMFDRTVNLRTAAVIEGSTSAGQLFSNG